MDKLSVRKVTCSYQGRGMCVAVKHGLVVVSDEGTMQLVVYSLADGSLVRTIESTVKGQFNFDDGGLCVCPDDDSVLLAERHHSRVQQVRIVGALEESSFVRFFGEGVLIRPERVDCNKDYVVVAERNHVSVLAWATGDLISKITRYSQYHPQGVRLLKGREPAVAVVDDNSYLSVFKLTNSELVATVGGWHFGMENPIDVLEVPGGFLVASVSSRTCVAKISRDLVGSADYGGYEIVAPFALAALPDGGVVVREFVKSRFQVFLDLAFRKAWIAACLWVC